MGQLQYHNKRLIILIVITISDFHCQSEPDWSYRRRESVSFFFRARSTSSRQSRTGNRSWPPPLSCSGQISSLQHWKIFCEESRKGKRWGWREPKRDRKRWVGIGIGGRSPELSLPNDRRCVGTSLSTCRHSWARNTFCVKKIYKKNIKQQRWRCDFLCASKCKQVIWHSTLWTYVCLRYQLSPSFIEKLSQRFSQIFLIFILFCRLGKHLNLPTITQWEMNSSFVNLD